MFRGLLTAFLIAVTTPALSEPAPGVSFVADTIMCDTQEQIMEIVAAGAVTFQPSLDKFLEFNNLKNDIGQATCAAGKWELEGVAAKQLGAMTSPDGQVMETWVIEVKSNDASHPTHPSYFVLWMEPIENAVNPSGSIPPKGRLGDLYFI